MGIELTFKCSGCSKTTRGTGPVRRVFHGVNGRDYGFGTWKIEPISNLAPQGWVPFDPYTNVTYCPECWDEIEPAPSEEG